MKTLPESLRKLASEIEQGAVVQSAVVLISHSENDEIATFFFGVDPQGGKKLMRDAAISFLERERVRAPILIAG